MIFGKTTNEQYEETQTRCLTSAIGKKKFAWLPVELESGEYIWLDLYYSFSSVSYYKQEGKFIRFWTEYNINCLEWKLDNVQCKYVRKFLLDTDLYDEYKIKAKSPEELYVMFKEWLETYDRSEMIKYLNS